MRKTIFWLHLLAGVIAGVVILVMSVTGVLLMYQRQITTWADGAIIKPPTDVTTRLPVETLLAKVREKETGVPSGVTMDSDPTRAASVSFGREKTLFVNPFTGEILSEGSKGVRKFFQVMIEWHRYLGMQGETRSIGKAITGACNLAFLFLVMSGFYLWWPRKWSWKNLKSVTTFESGLTGKARDWNWHNVIGFWSALPLAALVFTAVFFSYPWATDWLYRATGAEPPPRQGPGGGGNAGARAEGGRAGAGGGSAGRSRDAKKDVENVEVASLNHAWFRAEQQVSGWRTINLRVPSSAGASLVFTIDRGTGARPDLKGQLTMNGKTGEIEKWETYSDYQAARKIRLWVRWIHTGEAGGFVGQTIAGVASAGGAVLVWTGIALAIRRFLKRKRRMTEVETVEESVAVG